MFLVKGKEIVVVCCVCQRKRLADGSFDWMDVDPSELVSSTFCPPCFAMKMVEVAEAKRMRV